MARVRSLNALYRQIGGWLAESVATNLLKVGEVPIQLTEEQLGSYDAPSLKIVAPQGEAVYIVPKARFVVGAFGRVDFKCSPRRAMLIRKAPNPVRWQFAQLAPNHGAWSVKDLSEDSFWEELKYLLS